MVIKDSLKDVQKVIDDWIREHGGYWPPSSMICAILEELGELAREINSMEGYKPKKSNDSALDLGEELADLLFSIICIANYYKIDLGNDLNKTIKKYFQRDSNRFS